MSIDGDTQNVNFKEDVTIHCYEPLPQLNRHEIEAFAVTGKGKFPKKMFALVCKPELPPRRIIAKNFVGLKNPNFFNLVDYGVVFWPPAKAERFVFIYERNIRTPLTEKRDVEGLGLGKDQIIEGFVKPMTAVFQSFRDKGIIHGGICLSNIYSSGAGKLDKVILGDCLSVPCSYFLPSVYETIERAAADPICKGEGAHDDDLYSFGACIAIMLRHKDPMKNYDSRSIIKHKTEVGSFVALTGNERLPAEMLELLRGLLADDSRQRWNADEIQAWLDGQRLSPKQVVKKTKANRPIEYNGKKYFYPGLLAYDMKEDVTESVALIEHKTLTQWLGRAVEDKAITARFEKVMEDIAGEGKGTDFPEILTTSVIMALNPRLPIFYKDVRIFPQAIGTALAHFYCRKQDIQPFISILSYFFAMRWFNLQIQSDGEFGNLIGKLDACRSFLSNTKIGFGVERCLYYLCPQVHCMSDKLSGYYVTTPEQLMDAFEKISQKKDRPRFFFDRHITAFLSVKDRKNIDPYLPEINTDIDYKRISAELKTLATIQKRSKLGDFPGIAKWIADELGPLYARLHDRETQKSLKKKIDKIIGTGDITKIAALFDNPDLFKNDLLNFKRALREHRNLEDEMLVLQSDIKQGEYGRDTARQIAAIVSGILASIVILSSVFMIFGQKGIF